MNFAQLGVIISITFLPGLFFCQSRHSRNISFATSPGFLYLFPSSKLSHSGIGSIPGNNSNVMQVHCICFSILLSMQDLSVFVVPHFLLDMPIQINAQSLCPILHIMQSELNALFNAYDITGQSFAQVKSIFREAEFVISAEISAWLHLVEINAQSPGKV